MKNDIFTQFGNKQQIGSWAKITVLNRLPFNEKVTYACVSKSILQLQRLKFTIDNEIEVKKFRLPSITELGTTVGKTANNATFFNNFLQFSRC